MRDAAKNINEILSRVDHTLLTPTATSADIRAVCDDGMRFAVASVCIPPVFAAEARAYVGDRLRLCTVIGFPNGYSSPASKCFEASDAVKNGADEIDMVISLGRLRAKQYDALLEEIRAVKAACDGRILKVIVETCLLSEQEKIKMCEIVSNSGADYIKTSTGFSTGGATPEDVALLAAHVAPGVRVKAAGGIGSFEDAERLLTLGADRLGTSRLVALAKHAAADHTAY